MQLKIVTAPRNCGKVLAKNQLAYRKYEFGCQHGPEAYSTKLVFRSNRSKRNPVEIIQIFKIWFRNSDLQSQFSNILVELRIVALATLEFGSIQGLMSGTFVSVCKLNVAFDLIGNIAILETFTSARIHLFSTFPGKRASAPQRADNGQGSYALVTTFSRRESCPADAETTTILE